MPDTPVSHIREGVLPTHFETRIDAYRVDCMKAIERLSESDKNRFLLSLLMKRRVDGLNGRDWDAHVHLQWEDAISLYAKILGIDP